MSTQYNVEPQPTAKVLLKTSSGDILLSLWGQQCPLATRNFVQHCLDSYYNGTIFHRLVPDFILQGGDPTGLGTGGQSSFGREGAPFADEFHSRLRFNRRGLLGMANSGKDDNASQFFLTLGPTPELQGKNTMFGRVEGDTIFNLIRMGEAELAEEGGERPLYPTQITGTEVLVNPFEDMVARTRVVTEKAEGRGKDTTKKKRKVAKGALSFGAGEEGDAEPAVKRAKVNPNFGGAEEAEQAPQKKVIKPTVLAHSGRGRRKSTSSASESSAKAEPTPVAPTTGAGNANLVASRSPSPESEPEQVQKTMSALERTNAQIAALKQSMKRNAAATQPAPERKKSALEAMVPATSTRGRKRGKAGDDDAALDIFNAFKRKLGATATAATADSNEGQHRPAATNGHSRKADDPSPADGAADDEEKLCDLHFIANCQSCNSWADDHGAGGKEAEADDDDPNWMSHQLSFAKDLLGKDLEWKRKMEEFEVIDPREKTQDLKEERRKARGGEDRRDRTSGRREPGGRARHDRRERR